MIELKTEENIAAMRAAGRVLARTLSAVRDTAAVGVSLLELDEVARGVLREAGATSPFLGYRPEWAPVPFPAVLCTSVNDAIVHGIPTEYRLRDGDLLSVDCGAQLDGWASDSAITFSVGRARPEDVRLVETAERALAAGIAAAVVGNRIGDIAHAVGSVCRAGGYGIPQDFAGHGIGRRMHEDPGVPNEGRPGRGVPLRPGMVLAIEPMLLAGGHDTYSPSPDGWTLRTTDATRAAHVEHTVAITTKGPQILSTPTP
ncbi:type I methionyl aminopeptidase [Streptomyces sp. J2-1]|uniref:type I methionyl aminopeptidase n=1 Tax=Streptomyces corallincola TaxID=2851888 RepID=UPI001C385B76|nr:type I methionyl aminopeptidase [Streptomyces corallincola]MBV2356794.1 type I methionyl aminopeptidase [Streptomyces corallincola]